MNKYCTEAVVDVVKPEKADCESDCLALLLFCTLVTREKTKGGSEHRTLQSLQLCITKSLNNLYKKVLVFWKNFEIALT
jgi:hypothetical protein